MTHLSSSWCGCWSLLYPGEADPLSLQLLNEPVETTHLSVVLELVGPTDKQLLQTLRHSRIGVDLGGEGGEGREGGNRGGGWEGRREGRKEEARRQYEGGRRQGWRESDVQKYQTHSTEDGLGFGVEGGLGELQLECTTTVTYTSLQQLWTRGQRSSTGKGFVGVNQGMVPCLSTTLTSQ